MVCACLNWTGFCYAQQAGTDSVIPFTELAQTGHAVSAETIENGDSGRRQRLAALEQLPLGQLSPAAQTQARSVLDHLSLYRKLPTVELTTDSRVYDYFINSPDVAVSIWRAMEISNVQLTRSGPAAYQMDTRDGTTGHVEVLLRQPGKCLVLCQGQLQGPGLPRSIQARALMYLQSRTTTAGSVIHHCDLFVSFPSQTIETIARLTSPVSFRIADRNFEEISLFVSLMSNAMATQPGWVEQIGLKMDGVPAESADILRSVTASVYVDAERQRLSALGQPVTLEAILPPVTRQADAGTAGEKLR
jgi:hypothetical protein